MTGATRAVRFIDRHKGVAALFGAFMSVTAGATWWLATGGAVALTTSLKALSDPEVAAHLEDLPNHRARQADAWDELSRKLESLHDGQQQITDTLQAYRTDNERVVEWAPGHSQDLTDAVGGCVAGEPCTVYFRGRRTPAGASCKLVSAKPRLVLPDGREFPVQFLGGAIPLNLTTRFETVEATILVPNFIEPGIVGVVVWTIYAECPFAPEGETVDRETFRLLVEIKPA